MTPKGKRGLIEPFSVIVFLVVIGSLGGITYILTNKNGADISGYNYIGDTEKKTAYPAKCMVYVEKENRLLIPDVNSVKKLSYALNEECPI